MKANLRQKAYRKIKQQIIFFELKPGDKIFDSDIAKKLKISRTPVREALLMLENEKLLQCDKKLGYIVRRLNPKEVKEYFMMRKVMEDFATPFIIERITPAEIRSIKKNIENAEKAVADNDIPGIIRYETEFHQILYTATKSAVFIETILGLTDKFQWLRAIAINAHGGPQQSLAYHKKMLAAIEAKDAGRLRKYIARHLQHAEEKFSVVQSVFM